MRTTRFKKDVQYRCILDPLASTWIFTTPNWEEYAPNIARELPYWDFTVPYKIRILPYLALCENEIITLQYLVEEVFEISRISF